MKYVLVAFSLSSISFTSKFSQRTTKGVANSNKINVLSLVVLCVLFVVICQGFDSASTDTGTGQDGDKEDGDETEEKDEQPPEDRYDQVQ